MYRAKLKFPDLKRQVENSARQWQAKVLLIEDAASGQQLLQVLRNEAPRGVPRPIARKLEGDKNARFAAQSSRIEAGALFLSEHAPWRADFERELLGSPNVKYDAQVDALTQLLAWEASKKYRRCVPISEYPMLAPKIVYP